MKKPILLALSALFLAASSLSASAAPYDFENNYGKVKRLYPDGGGIYFTVGGPGTQQQMHPQNGYYFISAGQTNYDKLIGLVYLAAQNGWTLKIRTQPSLDAGHANAADVIYLVVDF